eukprot:Hpha_TRINITY_DN16931_c1_g1::TRINITY_DN16931_c1_g1_i1::g.53433::m.53433
MGCFGSKESEELPTTLLACVQSSELLTVQRGIKDPVVSKTIDVCANDGSTPLIVAVERNFEGIARALLTSEIAPQGFVNRTKKGDSTALHIAALRGYENMIELLLTHGANPHLQNDSGKTARDFTDMGTEPQDEAQRIVYQERAARKRRIADRLARAEMEQPS